MIELIEKLERSRSLTLDEYKRLVSSNSPENARILREKADEARHRIYGNTVFIRGLIEVGNYCRNDCLYCGIRRSNASCRRYRMNDEQILACCEQGYGLGFRTFVLQGGEDAAFTDDFLCGLIASIKSRHPDCAVTLSLGERSAESYRRLFDAGADRYLLRHETADEAHYSFLHPKEMSYSNRMACLSELKKIGYQVGCGFMVGSPMQSAEAIAKDLKFIEQFQPDMCGIGPFVPHSGTPFAEYEQGSAELTCYLLSIIRLIKPNILLPSTTALGTICPNGREMGILSGANIVMPNLSPDFAKEKYELYNGKIHSGAEAATSLDLLKQKMQNIGYEIVTDRGDIKNGTV